MVAHGRRRNVQIGGDLLVGLPVSISLGDHQFPLGQRHSSPSDRAPEIVVDNAF
jgi:hypothetical protein